eukprot:TRINITY_DN51073_c0_g1_i1.p1 TRINITY_DN51073_c0_g1~~TRINITY_DN51073_c0_g1_i1.p1  ORF type:complete len:336 (+),score=82.50 TRINITY_DN51073_c0_g1_i1:175-1182(+)
MQSFALDALLNLISAVLNGITAAMFHDHKGRDEGLDDVVHSHEVKLGVIFMILFVFLRQYIVGKLMLERLGEYLGIMVDSIALKLVNQWISLAMHLYSTLWGIVYLRHESWFRDLLIHGKSDAFFSSIYVDGDPLQMSIPFKIFYNVHLGYQLHALHFTVQEGKYFPADRRADYNQMLLHHVIAVLLIFLSYELGYVRLGVLVMISHNVGDITVCLTKTAKLVGWQKMSIHLLPFMMMTWLITRLIFFPFYIMRHVFLIPLHRVAWLHVVPICICNAGLCVLLGLNIFWFGKFIQMAHNAVRSGSALDITESRATNAMVDKYGLWNRQRWWQVGS